MEKKSVVYKKAFDFAIRIVNLNKYLTEQKKEYVMSKQVLRSGTSIGANIREAIYASSRRDYLNKMNIALKEAGETDYWLQLLKATGYIDKGSDTLIQDCLELNKILISIVKTTRETTEL